MPAHLTNYLVVLPILVWIVWRRVSRTFGQQQVRRGRMIFRVVLFAFIGCMLALTGLHDMALAEGLFGGVLIGGVVGLLGLHLTRFEIDPEKGDCYVPNPWIGGALTLLLLGRLAWRLMVLMPLLRHSPAVAGADAMQSGNYNYSPLTMLVIGLLVGYYIVYFSGLLIHHRRFQRANPSPVPQVDLR